MNEEEVDAPLERREFPSDRPAGTEPAIMITMPLDDGAGTETPPHISPQTEGVRALIAHGFVLDERPELTREQEIQLQVAQSRVVGSS